jgi:type IV secretion system protein TrbL
VAGAPQLGAGAAVGHGAAAVGTLASAAARRCGARAAGGGDGRASRGTVDGIGASTAYRLGQETSGSTASAPALAASPARAPRGDRMRSFGGPAERAERGQRAAFFAGARGAAARGGRGRLRQPSEAPAMGAAAPLRASARHHRHVALQASAKATAAARAPIPDIKEREDWT